MPILFSINVADESFESELLYVPSRNGYEICNIPLFICATEHKESGTLWDSNRILSVRGISLELMISRSAYCAKRSSWIAFCAFIVLFCGSSIYFCASLICFAALSNLSRIQKEGDSAPLNRMPESPGFDRNLLVPLDICPCLFDGVAVFGCVHLNVIVIVNCAELHNTAVRNKRHIGSVFKNADST